MIKKFLLTLLPLAAFALLTSEQLSDNGKAGATGSPGEVDCTDCHSSYTLNSGGGAAYISVSGVTNNEYIPGQTYPMSVTVRFIGRSLFGVGVEALTSSNVNGGTLNVTDAVHTAIKTTTIGGASRRNLVHTFNGGASQDSMVFNFSWTAPAAGAGTITFYYCGIAANNNGSESGDYVYQGTTLALTEGACTLPDQPSAINASSTSVCAGASVTYTIPAAANATSYTWSLPNGWTGTSTTTSITVTAGTTSGNVSVHSNNSCGSSASTTLSVAPVALTVNNSTTDVRCFGESNGSAVVTVSGGSTPYQYSWNTASGSGRNLNNVAAGSYQVTVTDANGCTRSASVVVAQPQAIIVTPTPTDASCNGSNDGQINVAVNGGVGTYSYTWSNSANTSTVSGLTAGSYSVTVTDANGCTQSNSATVSEPAAINITTAPAPDACTGSSTTVVSSIAVTGGTGAYTYSWSNGSTFSTDQNPTVTVGSAPETYVCTVTDANGCSGSESATVAPVAASFSVQAYVQGDTLYSSIATSAYTFQWYLNNTPITGATSPYWVPVANGDYTVVLSDPSTGCSVTSNAVLYGSLGLEQLSPSQAFSFYPNPANSHITLRLDAALQGSELRMLDMYGQSVYENRIDELDQSLSTAACSAGMYVITIEKDGYRWNRSVVIGH